MEQHFKPGKVYRMPNTSTPQAPQLYEGGYPQTGYPQGYSHQQPQQHIHHPYIPQQQQFAGSRQQLQQQPRQAPGYSLIRYPAYNPAPSQPTTYYIQQPQHQQQYYQTSQQHYQLSTPTSNCPPSTDCASMDVYNLAGQEEVVGLEEYTMGSSTHPTPTQFPRSSAYPAQYTVRIVPASNSNNQQRRVEQQHQRRMVQAAVPQFEEEEEEDEPHEPVRQLNVGGSVGQTIGLGQTILTPSTSTAPPAQLLRRLSEETEPVKRSRKQTLPSTGNRTNVINVIAGNITSKSNTAKGTAPPARSAPKVPKKEELPVIDKEAATNAQVQANQRIATPQGWRRMNEWIVAAEKTNNFKKLRDLLAQCSDSNITKNLLQMSSVDTPKIVLRLSKSSADKEIKEKAANLVKKWRNVVSAKDVPVVKVLKTSENAKPSEAVKKSPPRLVVHPQTEVGILDKLKEEMSADPLAKRPPIVPRPKTAKTKLSKPRSTGLEGDEDTSTIPTTAPAKRRASFTAKSLPLVRTNASGGIVLASGPATTISPPSPAAKPVMPKRSLMLSDSFMDELEDQTTQAAKKPKIVRKKISQVAQPISPVETTEGGLYSDTSKPSTSLQARKESIEEDSSSGSLAGQGLAPGRRRVRFADEHGSELVEIKFFEIEEGERINVNRLTSEGMKHLEMSREKNFMREQKGFHMSVLADLPMPFNSRQPPPAFTINQSGVQWKLLPIDDVIELIEPGSQCEAKVMEAKRRNTVMEAFYGGRSPLQILEIDDCDYPQPNNHVPAVIPLEPVLTPEDNGQLENPAASPAPSSSTTSSSLIAQLPLPLTNLSKLTASLPQSVTDLVANLPFRASKQEVGKVEEGPKSPSPKSPEYSPAEIQSPDVADVDMEEEAKKEKSPDGPESPDTEDVDIRQMAAEKKEEEEELDDDEDTDIRNTLIKLNEKTDAEKPAEQSVDVMALMNSLKKSGLLNKVQGASVLPAAASSNSMSAAMSAALAAAGGAPPPSSMASSVCMAMPSRFDNPPPRLPAMPGFLPPFSALPPHFPGMAAAAVAANRQFAGNVAAAALAVAPFSNPPPNCMLPPPGLLVLPPVIPNRLGLDQGDASAAEAGPPPLADHSSSSGEHKPVATTTSPPAPTTASNSLDTSAQMPLARTFVKQCTYYATGGCHFGEGCRFAHGEELTAGVKQAMAAVRGGGSRGGFRGAPRGGPRGPPGYGRPAGNANPSMSAVGGGVEIDYDEREGTIRTYTVPASHIMIGDPRGRGGRGRGRFTSPIRRGYYDERGSGGRYSSSYRRSRRSRSSSNSLSPVRSSGATRSRRSKTRSRSKSPTSSRRSSDRRESTTITSRSSQRKRRSSPMEQSSRRKRSPGRPSKKKSRTPSPTNSSSGSDTHRRSTHKQSSSSRRKMGEESDQQQYCKSSRPDEDSLLGESSSPGSALLLEITDCLASQEPLEARKKQCTDIPIDEQDAVDKRARSPIGNSYKSSSSRRRGKNAGSPTSSSSSPKSPDPAASDSSTTNTPPRRSRANVGSEDEEE